MSRPISDAWFFRIKAATRDLVLLCGGETTAWQTFQDIGRVLNYVARGEVDAGFVYRTDALVEPGKTRIAFTAATTTPVSYPIAVVAASKNVQAGRQFVNFVRSPAGVDILVRHGFAKP